MVTQAQSCDLKELVQKFIPESVGREIEKATSSIYPLQNVFIRKVKILKAPKFDIGKLMEVILYITYASLLSSTITSFRASLSLIFHYLLNFQLLKLWRLVNYHRILGGFYYCLVDFLLVLVCKICEHQTTFSFCWFYRCMVIILMTLVLKWSDLQRNQFLKKLKSLVLKRSEC